MVIAIPIFDRLTALDAVGPYEVLARVPNADVRFVASRVGAKCAESGRLKLVADYTLEEVPSPDIVVVPGGPGARDIAAHHDLVDWLTQAHCTSQWTTSVCTGSLLLGAAGLLDGRRATSHWLAVDELARYGAVPVLDRVVEDPLARIITCAGVSAGIDMALLLAARMTAPEVAQAIQLGIEYDPQPPFDCGSPAKAPREIVELVRMSVAHREGQA